MLSLFCFVTLGMIYTFIKHCFSLIYLISYPFLSFSLSLPNSLLLSLSLYPYLSNSFQKKICTKFCDGFSCPFIKLFCAFNAYPVHSLCVALTNGGAWGMWASSLFLSLQKWVSRSSYTVFFMSLKIHPLSRAETPLLDLKGKFGIEIILLQPYFDLILWDTSGNYRSDILMTILYKI